VKNEWSYIYTPQYVFMAWCLVKAQGHIIMGDMKNTHKIWPENLKGRFHSEDSGAHEEIISE
jgi:hypothetical protein